MNQKPLTALKVWLYIGLFWLGGLGFIVGRVFILGYVMFALAAFFTLVVGIAQLHRLIFKRPIFFQKDKEQ